MCLQLRLAACFHRPLAAARQLAASAAMRALRRAADAAADEATSGPISRRLVQLRARVQSRMASRALRPSSSRRANVMFEAVLKALPPAKSLKREEVPKGERCAVCHGKLLRKGRKARTLPCGHIFHDACILPWLNKSMICPMDRRDIAELLGISVEPVRGRLGADWVAQMVLGDDAAPAQLSAADATDPDGEHVALYAGD
ncbi:unnamed protein product [Polarella glacialis]|uniref:RING-type domain-containing protein n=1 Tax=Polarella glacialis TaxID=89957 RepID=A0A813KWZ3_POLGL|nr:unnamed protein product [Polarella glacialis]CAE8714770.1 unnamed protein product [Polarella glacialis]